MRVDRKYDKKYEKPSRAYDKYLKGVYYQDNDLKRLISPEKWDILDDLREGYPSALSAKDLMEEHGIEYSSAYDLSKELAKDQLIIATSGRDPESKREVTKYYFEDFKYIYNQREGSKHLFAPGYVEYDETFIRIYDRIRDKERAEKIHRHIIEFLEDIFKKSGIRPKPHNIAMEERMGVPHGGCGYDHQARDFTKATLLRLIDELETHPMFISFLNQNKIIDDKTAEELRIESQEERVKPGVLSREEKSLIANPERFKKLRPFAKGKPLSHLVFSKEYRIKSWDDIPEHLLKEMYERNRGTYYKIIESSQNYISKIRQDPSARELPDGSFLRTKADAKKMYRFCRKIKKLANLADSDWGFDY